MKTKNELFEKLWEILYPGKDTREKKIDPEVREVIEHLYDLSTMPEPDYDGIWNRVIKDKAFKRRYVLRRMLKYAAVIALPLLLVLGGIFLLNQESTEVLPMAYERPKNAILLTMSDGSELDLRKVQQEYLTKEKVVEIRQDSTKGLVYETTTDDDTVQRYHVLEIPVAADFRLRLSDGSVVYLNSGSKLKYPIVFKGSERKVFLEGEGYFEVVKDEAHPFKVEVRNVEVEVLGTSFNINAYPERPGVQTTLANGKVRVTSGAKQVVLLPGEQASCLNGGISVREVDVREFTSWKDGQFIFNRMSLKEIMEQMERWYGLRIVFFDSEIEKYTFTGMIDKNLPAEETFKVIEKVVDVHFSLKGGNVVVTKLK
jgi:putative anti-sigma factor